MNKRHYSKAPIIEAVIDIQVVLPSGFSENRLTEFAGTLSSKFPIRNNITAIQMQLDSGNADGEKHHLSSSSDKLGYRLSNDINSRVLQLKKTGFTFSHLPPYTNWECFGQDAREYWEQFLDYCKPEKVTRCAVRYINRIDIPISPIELEDYLNVYPHIPSGIPQMVNGMFLQLHLFQEDLNSTAVIKEAVVAPVIAGGFSIMLDIDLFKINSIQPNSTEVWDTLEQLRTRKNELFESFVTDKTRELIQ